MLLKLIFGWVGFAVCFFCDLNFFIQIALICSLFTIYSPLVFEEALACVYSKTREALNSKVLRVFDF